MKEAQRGSGMFVGLCWAGLEYVDGGIEYDEVSGTASAGYTDNRAGGLKAHADRLALTNPSFPGCLFLACPGNLQGKNTGSLCPIPKRLLAG